MTRTRLLLVIALVAALFGAVQHFHKPSSSLSATAGPSTTVLASGDAATSSTISATTTQLPVTATTMLVVAQPTPTVTNAPRPAPVSHVFVPPMSRNSYLVSTHRHIPAGNQYPYDAYSCTFRWRTDLTDGNVWQPVTGWDDKNGYTELVEVSGDTYYYDSVSNFPPSRSRRDNDAYYNVFVEGVPPNNQSATVRLSSAIYTSTGGC